MSFDPESVADLEDVIMEQVTKETMRYVLARYGVSDIAELAESQIDEVGELAQSQKSSVLSFGLNELISIWEAEQ